MTVPQSQIRVNSVEGQDPIGPVLVSYGATIPAGGTFRINGNANFVTGVITASSHSGTNVISSGILTATSFVGSASGFTNLPVINNSKSIAFTLIG